MFKIFKFGGSSINGYDDIKYIAKIISSFKSKKLIIVFSAIGNVTNMLEEVVDSYLQRDEKQKSKLELVKNLHYDIINNLFDENENIKNEVSNLFLEIEWVLEEEPINDRDYIYDQIVSIGELLSTKILSNYLLSVGFDNEWVDARDIIRTNNSFKNAKINWTETSELVRKKISSKNIITQGFIGCTSENYTTTLGREGSDFTAAILAYVLDANSVTIWKDVPGLMNADPKHFPDAKLFSEVSFDEAIELAYFGAKVIHPKTIQPLKKKNIPLKIKSFLYPEKKGTIVKALSTHTIPDIPSYIVKKNQLLISISDINLSFIIEEHISLIFNLLTKNSISVNMMQNSAISFSICIDNDRYKSLALIKDLQSHFKVFYNDNVSLYTARHYTQESLNLILKNKQVILEQKSRNTIQIIA